MNIRAIVRELERERDRIDAAIDALRPLAIMPLSPMDEAPETPVAAVPSAEPEPAKRPRKKRESRKMTDDERRTIMVMTAEGRPMAEITQAVGWSAWIVGKVVEGWRSRREQERAGAPVKQEVAE